MTPALSPSGLHVCLLASFAFVIELSPVGLSLTLLSLPAPNPFDWQLPGVKRLDFADQYFSNRVCPAWESCSPGSLRSPSGMAGELERLPKGRKNRAGRCPRPPAHGFHHSSWTSLDFVALCFCVISFRQKVLRVKGVCKPLT